MIFGLFIAPITLNTNFSLGYSFITSIRVSTQILMVLLLYMYFQCVVCPSLHICASLCFNNCTFWILGFRFNSSDFFVSQPLLWQCEVFSWSIQTRRKLLGYITLHGKKQQFKEHNYTPIMLIANVIKVQLLKMRVHSERETN